MVSRIMECAVKSIQATRKIDVIVNSLFFMQMHPFKIKMRDPNEPRRKTHSSFVKLRHKTISCENVDRACIFTEIKIHAFA